MKDKDLDMIISELEHTNRFLYELNKNLANLVLSHQVQLAAVEKSLQVQEEVIEIPRKKLH